VPDERRFTTLDLARALMSMPERALSLEVEVTRDGQRKRLKVASANFLTQRRNGLERLPDQVLLRLEEIDRAR
jgi:hypothetical protein